MNFHLEFGRDNYDTYTGGEYWLVPGESEWMLTLCLRVKK